MEKTEFTATLSEKIEIAKDVLQLTFTKPEGFLYEAGQFVQFLIPQGEKALPRSYSLSSIPTDDHLEFCVKILDGGVASAHFQAMDIGDEMMFRGPRGRFVVHENEHDHHFVATGVGLAPIMGMIRSLIESAGDHKPIRLIFGVRDEDDVFWIDRLEALKETSDLFEYHVTLSQPKPTGGWKGLKGRVTDHLLHHLMKHRYYLCGSADMVKDVRSLLIEHGVEAKDVHFEIF
ncbi:MAG: hypothetical protein COV60_02385 [Candidatus Magasanikbacteria bacterium CG11_big_fil_rev_8_21_14_0_20_43_7]|uniref:FAD-binding FR-type domain-containing protein n=1 Tax=Candidatus Magasanikbacteria bacterium CG11_big_fil_rev_8_21_14_0_20_43_7 TaxID=1974654 RepID=A0A2H0N2B4_9BACT|nr:MAG: hypothetical protein COV60_02385 [Candidatus Magasanikbacteria bacterium CG11_big_fil_rev_8_21_14_0_20_43_7]